MTTTPKATAARELEPLSTITLGIDSAWNSFSGWLDDCARIQQEMLRFLHRWLERDIDAIAHAVSCREATEVLDLQLHYASATLADSVALGLRTTALVNAGARRRYRRAVMRRQPKTAA